MSGGVSVGAGGSSGGLLPLQAGAGLDPARGSASPGYVERGSSGAGAWFAGLLVLVAVPGVNLVLGPVAMMVAGLRDGSRRVEPGRSNGRRAASWGLTFLLGEALLIGAQLYIGKVVFGPGERVTLFPWGLPAVLGLILMVSHFVVCIAQGVRAHRGGVTRFGGIPFFR